jgi:hypothetical protein
VQKPTKYGYYLTRGKTTRPSQKISAKLLKYFAMTFVRTKFVLHNVWSTFENISIRS